MIIGGVSFADKMLFTRRIAVMLKAGIPISETLAVLENQSANPVMRKVLADVGARIKNGQTLTKSLEHHPRVFDSLYLSIVSVGEESGKLEENLEYLAAEMGKTYEFQRRVKGAMLYPMLIVTAALGVGGWIGLFVLPKLVTLFKSLGVKLPLSTQILLIVAQFMKDYGLWVVGAAVAAGVGGWLWAKSPIGKPVWDRIVLTIPVWGRLAQNIQVAGFCRNMGLMLKAGLPVAVCLETAKKAAGNTVFRKYFEKVGKAVDQGKSLEKELVSGSYKYFPLLASRMIGVGERTGKLDETLLYLGGFYEEEVDDVTKNMGTILEPALLLVIAVGVAFMAMAIISPIYEFTGSIKR
ncbi:MAG: MSHA bioproteinis protein MshG [Microgenomates group bacterium Gr01-1014_16]|nr:MAG: MSHA bioproteinis protein MshG [Microgenomates group bacterium Gr01-1014_16]